MKKIFIAIMALAVITACSKETSIEVPQGDSIAFGGAFVDNTTKAIYEKADNLTGFTVWGNVNGTASLYGDDGATVERGTAQLGAAWSCTEARYWTPSCTYNFTAIANGTAKTVVNGIPTHISYTINPEDAADLLYGTTTASTNESCVPTTGVNTAKVVTFTLRHLLSRLQVSFQNLIPGTEYTYTITDVKITTWDKGVYEISSDKWSQDGTATAALPFSNLTSLKNSSTATSSGAQLVIPGSSVVLSFNYVLSLNGAEIYKTTTPVSKTIENTLTKGYSYNINVQLKAGNQIDFSVSETNGLAAWGTGATSDVTLQ